jgi:trehalose 6-phosphate synthase/phosphatase
MASHRAASFDSPLFVASCRAPFELQRVEGTLERRRSSSGLASALEPVLRKRGGTWLGWPGGEFGPDQTLSVGGDPYRIAGISLSEVEVSRYFHGFSNRTLWPLFHSLPQRTGFDPRDWEAYEQVNRRFADVVLEQMGEGDVIWIHDYHLLLVPSLIRAEVRDSRLAFFLHVPFPPFDIYRLLPWHRTLLSGLLSCDLIGFHVESYARNFFDCAERALGARVDRRSGMVFHQGHASRVGAFPIGIDWESFEAKASAAPPSRAARRERVILGVDRLDYTKGILERIRAVEVLLDLHPEHREKVLLVQVAVPSRSQVAEYRDLKREIEGLVGRVNGRFATANWSPICYLYRSFSHDRLAALYRDADVALVTPLRDGMNLVAKEFVACQVADPGALILSRMAGAAETMREALLVNPYDVEETAGALHRALRMKTRERRSRMEALRERERANDVHAWVRSFLAAFPESGCDG